MRHIPLLAEEGWLRHQENAAKPQRRRRRARSASAITRSRNSGQFGWPSKGCRTDHPVRDKSERIHFLMSRTPLLCEEGNVRPENFVQKTKSCSLVTHRGIAATKKENSPQRRRELFVLVNQRQAVAADCGSSNPSTTRLIPSRKSGA